MIEVNAQPLGFLTMEEKVIIPFFQRTYVWDEENWKDLIEELCNERKANNFLGNIILKHFPSVSGKSKEAEVIDGQQRLTTLSILLRALYDSFLEEIRQNFKGKIFKFLFYRKDYTSPEYGEIKIKHSFVDSESYRKVITQPETIDLKQIDIKNEKINKILRCYKFFRNEFENMKEEEKRKLLNKILDPDNKIFVVIDLEERDDEQSIFDTLNTAGVRLTSAEIIKNALFKRLIELSNREEAIKIYKETWEKTFLKDEEKDEETLAYWEKELTTGRLKRQNIEILLHSVAVIEGFYDPDEHTLSNLSKLYKEKKIKNFKTSEELKEFINKIIDYAKIYRDNIYDFDKSDIFSFSNDLDGIKKRLLHILNILDISTFHPFILYIIKSKDETKQKEYLKRLEDFVICNAVAQKVPIKNYNKLVKNLIKDPSNLSVVKNFTEDPLKLKNILENLGKDPSNLNTKKIAKIEIEKIIKEIEEDIGNDLERVPDKLASLILFWIELYRRYKEGKNDTLDLKYTYSLEHIMPVKWDEYWGFDKVPHPNANLTDVKKEKDRDEKIKWLGNMTLLRSRLNTSLRNYDFEHKINGYGGKRGMRKYAELLITKEDIIEKFDQGNKTWNEEKIESRTKELMKIFLEIWCSNIYNVYKRVSS